jgi:dCMP deaminase
MATQKSLDEAYMGCARAIAALSYAERKKVGAILVSGGDGHGIIAEGYNGTPSGFDNVCEVKRFNPKYKDENGDFNIPLIHKRRIYEPLVYPDDAYVLETRPEVLHAESNAIAKVAKSTNSSKGATLYVTCSPCYECSKMIIQAGITRVVYEEEYRLTEGLALLRKAKIEVNKL